MTTSPRTIAGGALFSAVPVLFTMTIFTSAALLFFVQPLFTKVVLPHIGGAPAVWTTAMLFFQTVLIAGYLYAHLLTRYLPVKLQLIVHMVLWAAALWFLPLSMPEGWRYDAGSSAAMQTLALYALGVGLPFAVLSANAPLIQAWYGQSGGHSAHDPYFLYGASNLGSLLALLLFPLAAEPLFGATEIGLGWASVFVVLGLLLLTCGIVARQGGRSRATASAPASQQGAVDDPWRLFRWAFLAFIPSSLMLGVTSKMSTDLGSFPLIWVLPLSLFLLTFVLTFTTRPLFAMSVLRPAFAVSLVVMAVIASNMTAPTLTFGAAGLLLAAFLIVGLMAHRTLFDQRPVKSDLTLFYVTMSIGGALGGLFNSIIAPLLFSDFYELRVTIGLAALLLIARGAQPNPREIGLGILFAVLAIIPVTQGIVAFGLDWRVSMAVVAGLVLLAATMLPRFSGATGAAAVIGLLVLNTAIFQGGTLLKERSFFGVHKVIENDGIRRYYNGTTMHGVQMIGEDGDRPTGLSYYSVNGSMGQVLHSSRGQAAETVGIVGLGIGSLSCYRNEGQDWHLYEIDKAVDDIARNPELFTFMSSCAGDSPTHLGDARVVLAGQEQLKFDILVIDAFSSDAVPVHLITAEAVQLYRERLALGGVVLFHISNRYYALDRPLARIAEELGLEARIRRFGLSGEELERGETPSIVAAMGEDAAALESLSPELGWEVLESPGGRVWTDDYANLLSIVKW